MKVHLAKGARDHLPAAMHRRNQVMDTVRRVFTRYGFEPLETPAFERIETLMGKYGDEGEKLIYRILKRGQGGQRGEVDLALRYDLTVPLARVVAMHPEVPLPFKRYQMQPVWRADRPQRGRFREFYQCDVDTVGSTSLVADAECVAVFHDCLVELGFTDFTIRLNHRKLLWSMAALVGALDQEAALLTVVDKLDKLGLDAVLQMLRDQLDFDDEGCDLIRAFLAGRGEEALERNSMHEPIAAAELREGHAHAVALGVEPSRLVYDPTLARGLDYYTGPVFEAVVTEPKIGSIGGGGRYDGLIGMFGKQQVPAVGISVGLERILVVMEELGMLPEVQTRTEVFVTVFSEELLGASMAATTAFRAAGVNAQVTLGARGKLGKQLKRIHRLGVRYAVVIGPDEVAAGQVVLRDLFAGEQHVLSLVEAVERVGGG